MNALACECSQDSPGKAGLTGDRLEPLARGGIDDIYISCKTIFKDEQPSHNGCGCINLSLLQSGLLPLLMGAIASQHECHHNEQTDANERESLDLGPRNESVTHGAAPISCERQRIEADQPTWPDPQSHFPSRFQRG